MSSSPKFVSKIEVVNRQGKLVKLRQREGERESSGRREKVEVTEESVTNFSISKSSEHSNVVQETFNLSHNLSE